MSPPVLKLIDALALVAGNSSLSDRPQFDVGLVCGFTPLHLQTFFTAHLRQRMPDRRISVRTGLFGDVPGTLRTFVETPADAVAVVLEWSDIDKRLGIRELGGWSPRCLSDIVEHAAMWLEHLLQLVRQVAATTRTVVSLPTLPLAPAFFTAPWQASVYEANLQANLWRFAAAAAAHPRIRVVNPQEVDLASASADRLNVAGTLTYGFPYRNHHAERLAAVLARAVDNPQPMKGLITDLDDTLWAGIVGDDGIEKISWDLDHHTQAHGLYQQLLSTLSEEGVLVGVVSKNDPSIVEAAFERDDLLLPRERIFPLAVSWGSKADAVGRVLAQWNIGPDRVVFVDDNPIELEEVKAAHPAIDCLRFPHRDPQGVYDLLIHLRNLFGRDAISEEDTLRLDSLRASAESRDLSEQSEGYSEALLERSDASLVLDFTKDAGDARAFELICKTNQFNLNGRRPTEREWAEYLRDPQTFLLTATYKDRFGALGKIAVVAGRVQESRVDVETWVMSCRAFSRRIEHQCLKALFDRFGARKVSFAFHETPRNGPIARFLAALHGGPAGAPLTADAFHAACPRLFHRVVFKDACPAGN
jgi:FkbH-like protein